jgi:hypothetical protein
MKVSQTLIMCSTFCLAFPLVISFFLFWFVQAPSTSKDNLMDGELMTISSRICHFLIREYILPRGTYHTPDDHMGQFIALCDYMQQGWAKQMETHRKFKEICGCQ